MLRRTLGTVSALLLALATLPLATAPVAATDVGDDAAFRAAWSDPNETLITLTSDIALNCGSGVLLRSSTTAIVVDGAGFELTSCNGSAVLWNTLSGAIELRDLSLTGNPASLSGLVSAGDVTITDSTISQHGEWGVIGVDVTVTGSTISGNGERGITANGDLTITDSTISNNHGDGAGAAGEISVTDSTISTNDGHGLTGLSSVSVTNSTITENGNDGINAEGGVTVSGSTLSANGGDGIDVDDAPGTLISVTDSSITANGEQGIDGNTGVDVTVASGSVIGSNAEHGIATGGDVVVDQSRVTGNGSIDGGGILSEGGAASVTRSTIDANVHEGVSAVDVTATNSTIVDNGPIGVQAVGELVVEHGTVSGHDLNLVNATPTTIHLFASVVVDAGDQNCAGPTVVDEGYNFVDDGSCGSITANGADPQLGGLADNGGTTPTRLPAGTSPLVDAIPTGDCDPANTTDQRGDARPQGNGCDIGAVEVAAAAVPSPSPTPAPSEPTPSSPASSATPSPTPAAGELPDTATGSFEGVLVILAALFALSVAIRLNAAHRRRRMGA